MKDFWEEPQEKKINKKKIIISVILIILVITLTTIFIVYVNNREFRNWVDKNILRKEVLENNVNTIELQQDENVKVCAYNRYIGVLNKNIFRVYDNTGKKEQELEIQITNPLFEANNRFLGIAESKGQKLYLISNKEIMWEGQIEGNISQIHVNKNGYVAVVIVDTSYKTVIQMFNSEGKEMFKTYLSSTRVSDISISNDNKYLAIAEIDTAGTMIKSNIKIISIEKAQTDPINSVINTYAWENNELVTNIEYQDKDKLICMDTNSIHMVVDGNNEVLTENGDKKITFSSIKLSENVVNIEEKSSGLFTADSIVKIINTTNRKESTYTANGVVKEIYTYSNIIGLNLGTEIHFINTNGWLNKKYIAEQEITNVVLSESLAGIVYRDKIEIINL